VIISIPRRPQQFQYRQRHESRQRQLEQMNDEPCLLLRGYLDIEIRAADGRMKHFDNSKRKRRAENEDSTE
jgi:hypothetical protein